MAESIANSYYTGSEGWKYVGDDNIAQAFYAYKGLMVLTKHTEKEIEIGLENEN